MLPSRSCSSARSGCRSVRVISMPGEDAWSRAAARETTVDSTDWNPATRTRPVRNPARAASSSSSDPLDQLEAPLLFEACQVVADRGLGVVELLSGASDRGMTGHRGEDLET